MSNGSFAEYEGAIFPPEGDVRVDGTAVPVDSFASYEGAYFPVEGSTRAPLLDIVPVQSATHTHIATEPWIQAPALSDDATHVHVATSPLIGLFIEPDDATHVHVSTSPAIVAGISVDNATHVHVATSPVIGLFIEPEDATHVHAASEPNVLQTDAVVSDGVPVVSLGLQVVSISPP